MRNLLLISIILITKNASSEILPDWTRTTPPESTEYRYYVGVSPSSDDQLQDLTLATYEAINQAITENFGIMYTNEYEISATDTNTSINKNTSINSENTVLKGFSRKEVIRTGELTYVLFKYDKNEIKKEQKRRLSKIPEFNIIGSIDLPYEIKITTNPTGAKIYINDEPYSKSPAKIHFKSEDKEKSIRIKVEAIGYETEEKKLYLEINEINNIHFNLKKSPSYINVNVKDIEAEVYIDEKYVGKSPIEMYKVSSDKLHKIKVKHKFANTKNIVDIKISPGDTYNENVELKLKQSFVSIKTTPSSQIYLFSKYQGMGDNIIALNKGKNRLIVYDDKSIPRIIDLNCNDICSFNLQVNLIPRIDMCHYYYQKDLDSEPRLFTFNSDVCKTSNRNETMSPSKVWNSEKSSIIIPQDKFKNEKLSLFLESRYLTHPNSETDTKVNARVFGVEFYNKDIAFNFGISSFSGNISNNYFESNFEGQLIQSDVKYKIEANDKNYTFIGFQFLQYNYSYSKISQSYCQNGIGFILGTHVQLENQFYLIFKLNLVSLSKDNLGTETYLENGIKKYFPASSSQSFGFDYSIGFGRYFNN